jgi:hypothetical protein
MFGNQIHFKVSGKLEENICNEHLNIDRDALKIEREALNL